MKRPKCRLCGKEHYSHEPHAFDEPLAVSPPSRPAPQVGKKVAPAKAASGFDRSAYQREYMRKWRAKRTARLKELESMLKAKEMLE